MTKRIALQPRDHKLFRILSSFGYLTTHQIANHVLKAPYKQTARRLKLLREAGFVGYVTRRDGISSRVYIPIPKGLEGVVELDVLEDARKSMENKPWFRSLHEHEDTVREMALRFQNAFTLATVVVDHQMKPSSYGIWDSDDLEARKKLPDFVLQVEGKKPIWVEVELSTKSDERYNSIFYKMLDRDDRSVLYLTKDRKLKEKLSAIHFAKVHNRPDSGKHKRPKVLFFEIERAKTEDEIRAIVETLENSPQEDHPQEVHGCPQRPTGLREIFR